MVRCEIYKLNTSYVRLHPIKIASMSCSFSLHQAWQSHGKRDDELWCLGCIDADAIPRRRAETERRGENRAAPFFLLLHSISKRHPRALRRRKIRRRGNMHLSPRRFLPRQHHATITNVYATHVYLVIRSSLLPHHIPSRIDAANMTGRGNEQVVDEILRNDNFGPPAFILLLGRALSLIYFSSSARLGIWIHDWKAWCSVLLQHDPSNSVSLSSEKDSATMCQILM